MSLQGIRFAEAFVAIFAMDQLVLVMNGSDVGVEAFARFESLVADLALETRFQMFVLDVIVEHAFGAKVCVAELALEGAQLELKLKYFLKFYEPCSLGQ